MRHYLVAQGNLVLHLTRMVCVFLQVRLQPEILGVHQEPAYRANEGRDCEVVKKVVEKKALQFRVFFLLFLINQFQFVYILSECNNLLGIR